MADARAKAVESEMADLVSQNIFVPQIASTPLRPPGFNGDIIEVPSITDLTVIAAGSTDTNPEAVTTNILSLNANLEPWINAKLPQMAAMQLMNGGGNWARGVAKHALGQIMNDISSKLLTYMVKEQAYDATGTYHVNVAADTLTNIDILNAKAALLNNNGALERDLVLIVGPYAEASIRSIATFVPNYQAAENGDLGIPRMGSVNGVPVYVSQSVPRLRTVASTAWQITSNVVTATVAAGHGIVAGQKITFNTVTANGDVSTAVAVTSVTSTTVVFPKTQANEGPTTEAGTITIEATESVMIDKAHTYTSIQLMPKTRVVPLYNSTADALQISAVWGRVARAGRQIVINSPPTSA